MTAALYLYEPHIPLTFASLFLNDETSLITKGVLVGGNALWIFWLASVSWIGTIFYICLSIQLPVISWKIHQQLR